MLGIVLECGLGFGFGFDLFWPVCFNCLFGLLLWCLFVCGLWLVCFGLGCPLGELFASWSECFWFGFGFGLVWFDRVCFLLTLDGVFALLCFVLWLV